MSNDDIEIDYGYLAQNALRNVIRDVLEMTETLGDTPGDHHFYIEFLTTYEGVSIPDHLIESFPLNMTIVLQHKFEDLKVEDDQFSVTLHFNGAPDRLVIPFDAITSFVDPSTDFALRFETVAAANSDESEASLENEADDDGDIDIKPAKKTKASQKDSKEKDPDESAEVVSLDSFRKK